MRAVVLDIETAPNLADVWSLWNVNVSLNQLRASSYTLGFGYKWLGESKTHWVAKEDVPEVAYGVLDEADIVISYNGKRFDTPTLQKDLLLSGLRPPSPFKQVDLYAVVKRQFRFPSNKLAYVTEALGLGSKLSHQGHDLWVGCMSGDTKSWKTMEKYCKQDVKLTEQLYYRLLPWITDHPNTNLYNSLDDSCKYCGETALRPRGYAYTLQGKFHRFCCEDCGGWSRGVKRIEGVNTV